MKGNDMVTSEPGRRGIGTSPHTRSQTLSSGLSHSCPTAPSGPLPRRTGAGRTLPPGSLSHRPSCEGRGRPRIRGARGPCLFLAGASCERLSVLQSGPFWTLHNVHAMARRVLLLRPCPNGAKAREPNGTIRYSATGRSNETEWICVSRPSAFSGTVTRPWGNI